MKKVLTLLLTFFSFIWSFNALNNITINNNKLIPSFEKEITSYNVFVNDKIEIITVNADIEEGETVTGCGSKSLKKGLNEIEIHVYKENILEKKYILNVVRGEIEYDKNDATLKNLIIENHEINFRSDTYEYIIDANEEEKDIIISYEASNPKSQIKLTGNTNLTKEENIIKIEIKSENKKSTNEYIIKVNKNQKKNDKKNNVSIFDKKEFSKFELKMIIIALILIGILILGILFYFIFIKKRKKYKLIIKNINLSFIKKKGLK